MTRIGAFTATMLMVLAASLPASASAQAATGDLDASFSGDGRQTTDFGASDYGQSVALQADGRIVVAGGSGGNFALARYRADGLLDPSFAGGGTVTTDLGGSDYGQAMALDADGRIVVAGGSGGNFALARYSADGLLDPSFAGGGTVTTDLGGSDYGQAMALDADGRIVVAGGSGGNFALARYSADGSLDPSFAGDGTVTTDLGGSEYGQAVAIRADGTIVVAGSSDGNRFALARYSADGSLDTSLSGDGTVTTDLGGHSGNAAAIQADGRIVVVGAIHVVPAAEYALPHDDFALARYTADGALDASFGAGGRQTTDFGSGSVNDIASAVAIQADGRIVVAGGSSPVDWVFGSGRDFALARYDTNGSPDTSFGAGGRVVTGFSEVYYDSDDFISGVAIQPDGRIVAAGGTMGEDWMSDIGLARYHGGDAGTTITGGPSGTTSGTAPSFTFTATAPGSTFECRLDGPGSATGGYTICTSPKAYSALADGSYTFSVRATAAGSTTGTPATQSFTVDTVAPDMTITAGPTGTTSLTTPQFAFTSSDPDSSFDCALAGPGPTPGFGSCTSPRTLGPLAYGSYTFSVRATDPAGNATTATRSFTVATVAPDTSITGGPSGLTNGTAPSFAFSATLAGSTFECKLDTPSRGGSYAGCTSPRAYATTVNGAYTFSVRASNSGSTDASPASRSFTVDTVAPNTTLTGGPSGVTNGTAPSFAFTAGAGSTFSCKLNTPSGAGSYAACTSPRAYTTTVNGSYTFSVRATDPAGNTDASPATRSFTVDTVAPTLTPGDLDTSFSGDGTQLTDFGAPDWGQAVAIQGDGAIVVAGGSAHDDHELQARRAVVRTTAIPSHGDAHPEGKAS